MPPVPVVEIPTFPCLAILASFSIAVMATPCMEDPNKVVGQTWQCDDPTCDCTCLANGHVEATCPPQPGQPEMTLVSMEEILVKIAFAACLALMLCFAVMCCFMFRKNKGTRTREQVLQEVDDIEMEDNQ